MKDQQDSELTIKKLKIKQSVKLNTTNESVKLTKNEITNNLLTFKNIS